MKIELNTLIEEIHSWKTLLKAKDEEIEKLHNQVAFKNNQNTILEETQATLLQEISQFNNALSTLHNSISRLERHEAEKKALMDEKETLKDTLDAQKMLHQEEIEELKIEMQNIKSTHAKELERERSEALVNASSNIEKYLEQINEKENTIHKLEEDISKLKSKNDRETLQIKIKYEEKITKLKNRLTKPKHPFHDDLKKDDIFRQKYIKLEKESKEEISKLNYQIKELQSQINSRQTNNLFPNVHQFNSFNGVVEETEKINSYEEQSLHPFKRFKTANKVNDENDIAVFNTSRNQTDLVKPVKKKLFNIDMNYFVK